MIIRIRSQSPPRLPLPWLPKVRLEVVLEVALVAEPLGADLAFYDQTPLGPALARLLSHDV